MTEQQQAAAGGTVMAGAEGERRFDLDADLVRRDAGAVVLTMNHETSRWNGNQIVQAHPHPVLGFDHIESQVAGDLGTGSTGHEIAHHGLIRRLGKMQGDIPAPVRPLEGRNRRFSLEEDLGEDVDDAARRLLVRYREADAVGGRGGVRGHCRQFNRKISQYQ